MTSMSTSARDTTTTRARIVGAVLGYRRARRVCAHERWDCTMKHQTHTHRSGRKSDDIGRDKDVAPESTGSAAAFRVCIGDAKLPD